MRSPIRTVALVAAAHLAAVPASATFHFMSVVEVYAGDAVAPDAQYVVLQMYSAGQNSVGGHTVAFYDADGNPAGSATFSGSVPSGADQARILVATSTAETRFGLTANLRMPGAIVPSGGKVCFVGVDCMAWGDYSPSDASVGTPFQTVTGIEPGDAALRRLDVCSTPGCSDVELDGADDTDDSANDFVAGAPVPQNNAGAVGSIDSLAVFLHGFENTSVDGWSAVLGAP